MSVRTAVRTTATPEEQSALGMLMAEPETSLSDAPLHTPSAAGALLLGLLLILSPATPKEPKRK
jgi:hypothetical protein